MEFAPWWPVSGALGLFLATLEGWQDDPVRVWQDPQPLKIDDEGRNLQKEDRLGQLRGRRPQH